MFALGVQMTFLVVDGSGFLEAASVELHIESKGHRSTPWLRWSLVPSRVGAVLAVTPSGRAGRSTQPFLVDLEIPHVIYELLCSGHVIVFLLSSACVSYMMVMRIQCMYYKEARC